MRDSSNDDLNRMPAYRSMTEKISVQSAERLKVSSLNTLNSLNTCTIFNTIL
jgi:hypothetical protein